MNDNTYNIANHDFTLRHALQNQNSLSANNDNSNQTKKPNPRLQHLWNTATSYSTLNKELDTIKKSHSEPTINNHIPSTITNIHLKKKTAQNNTTEQLEYSEQESEQIVRQFVKTFPHFKEKLAEQFPKEWLNPEKINDTQQISDSNQLFQISQLERTEKERVIQELYEYAPVEK